MAWEKDSTLIFISAIFVCFGC